MSISQARSTVFISYSHDNADWLKRLRVHLKPLERFHDIEVWDDTKIVAGSKWREEIGRAVGSARVAVLLISATFLASDFIEEDELPDLLNAAQRDGATILPVIISACGFRKVTKLCQFQAVNDPSTPLIDLSYGKQEEVLEGVVTAIEACLRPPRVRNAEPRVRSRALTAPLPEINTAEPEAKAQNNRLLTLMFGGRFRKALMASLCVALLASAFLVGQRLGQDGQPVPTVSGAQSPTIKTYTAYITLEPLNDPARPNMCIATYHVAIRLEAPSGQVAVYQDRIKTKYGGIRLESTPASEVLNPNQFPANDTLLDFEITDTQNPGPLLDIEAVAVLNTVATRDAGKIGPHIPYAAEYVQVVVDFSRMGNGFPPPLVRGEREYGPSDKGRTQPLPIVPHPLTLDRNNVTLIDRNVPKGSSLLLKWGQ